MKYVKLFESFISKYELIKPLPSDGKISVDDEDQCYALQMELINMGYDWFKHSNTSFIKSERINKIPTINMTSGKDQYPLVITWQSHNKRILRTQTGTSIHDDAETAEFNDYFKFNHENRGRNLKRFGV